MIELTHEERGCDDDDQISFFDTAGIDSDICRLGDDFGIESDHAELELQLTGHKSGVGEGEDEDMGCAAHGVCSTEYLFLVQHGGGIDQHVTVILADGCHKAGLGFPTGFLHGVVEVILGQGDLKAVEALEADLFAEAVDAGFRGVGVFAMAVMVLVTTLSALWITYCAISFSLTVRLCCMEIILAITAETTNILLFLAFVQKCMF